jgi:type II secretory pathway component PulL
LRVIDRAVEPGRAALDLDWTEETLAQPSDAELAKRFSEGLSAGRGINLFQGDYRAKSGLNVPRVPMIRFAALAASALLALFVWNGVQDRVALAQAQDLRTKTATEYSAVTGNRAPTNPGRVAAQSLSGAPTQEAGFLDLSSVLFTALSSLDDIRVDQLRFNAENGTFQLRLIYPSFDAAARVENAVRQAGGKLTTGDVREQNGVFVGEASLTMGDPS